jgi:hypothetical protein
MNYLSADDLVFYKDPKDNNIKSMGFDVESLLLNKSVNNNSKNKQGIKMSHLLNNLMIPSGLVFQKEEKQINRENSEYDNDNNKMNYETNMISEFIDNTKVIGEDIFSKLVGLVEIEPVIKKNRNTRRFKDKKSIRNSTKKHRDNLLVI